jgi:ferredoxin-NADP reductase
MLRETKAVVVKRKDLTDDLFCLWLDPECNGKFKFKPGQYCAIGISDKNNKPIKDSRGRRLLRPYSIVSAPHEERIELFIELVRPPEGNLTPLLHNLRIGDEVDLLLNVKGVFTFEPAYKNHIMVATVTGIAPFVSILRDYLYRCANGRLAKNEKEKTFYVFHGASYMDELVYYDDLCAFETNNGAYSDMTVIYIPTVSRPDDPRNAGWVHEETGRVNTLIEDFISQMRLRSDNTLVYACGNSGMIEDVKARLLPKGWKIKEEKYLK